jgi:acyl-CoA thioesterase
VSLAAPTPFDRDTAVERLAPGRYEAAMSKDWWILRGPNGGYVAAVLLRAMVDAVGDAARAPRSLTVHYTAPPAEGATSIETTIEREGRSLTTVSARMRQGERLLALALGAFSPPWKTDLELRHARMPAVPSPAATPPMPPRQGGSLPMHARYEYRHALGGAPFSGADEALVGGWMRLSTPRPVDALAAAAYCDAWPPTVMPVMKPGLQLSGFPTIDLTVHFRSVLPVPGAAADDWTLAVFRAREVREGFFEEDGELWSPDGQLLVHSRQLAIVM